MSIKKIFFLTVFSIFLSSCATFNKKIALDKNIKITAHNLNTLEGIYTIHPTIGTQQINNYGDRPIENNALNRYTIFNALKELDPEFQQTVQKNPSDYSVKIKVKTNKRLTFFLQKNKNTIDSISVKYKIKKDGYVYLKNSNFKIKNVPLIYGGFKVNKVRLTLNEENNLILDHSYYTYHAALLFIGNDRTIKNCNLYTRQK